MKTNNLNIFGISKEDIVMDIMEDFLPKPDVKKLISSIYKVERTTVKQDGNVVKKNQVGIGACWGFLPHFIDVKIKGKSIGDKIKNDKKQIASKIINFCEKHEGSVISKNRVLQSFKAYNGHAVSDFSPAVAKYLIEKYTDINSRVVFDPCSGWGGRMIGSIASNAKMYIGIDASVNTVKGLNKAYSSIGCKTIVEIRHGMSECSAPFKDFADISITSPPYYNQEVYSEDSEQSCNQYKTYDDWRDIFLFGLIWNMKVATKKNGVIIINISDVQGLPLVEDSRKIAGSIGLFPLQELKYEISSISGKGAKTEPILIWRNS